MSENILQGLVDNACSLKRTVLISGGDAKGRQCAKGYEGFIRPNCGLCGWRDSRDF
jgi:hypothetical protein